MKVSAGLTKELAKEIQDCLQVRIEFYPLQIYYFRLFRRVFHKLFQELKMSPRYKFIVSINYGENQGQRKISLNLSHILFEFLDFSFGLRTLWDSDSDKHQNISFKNDLIFCTVDIFGIYHY